MLPETGPGIFFLNKNSMMIKHFFSVNTVVLFFRTTVYNPFILYIYKYSVIKGEIIFNLLIIYHIIINVYLNS